MTDLLRDVETPSDAELISRVRGGDVAAYGELFTRHKEAANRLARQLVRGPDSDDLVSEAFAKVLHVLQGGGGPDVAFRAYLLTAVRRLHIDRVRGAQRLHTTDDLTPFDPGVPFQDTAVAGFESGAAAKAFASLPERWQLVLWHLEVEGQKPADIAPLLGMSANSVSALAYRAREGLRQAFLTMHLSDISDSDCQWVNEHLGAFVRKGLAKRDVSKVQTHLAGCRRCTAMYLELQEVNSDLSAIIAPLLLGAAAAGYLASVGGSTAVAIGSVGILSRARDVVLAHSGPAAAAAAGVAAAAAVAVIAVTGHNGSDGRQNVVADPAVGVTSTAPLSPVATGGPTPSGFPSATATGSVTAGPTSSTSPGTSPSTAPTPTLFPTVAASLPVLVPSVTLPTTSPTSPATSPVSPPAGSPTQSPTQAPTGPSGSPSGTPTAPVTTLPSDSPSPPTLPDPVVGVPRLDAAGTVTVDVHGLRAADRLDVTVGSAQTTFAPDLAVPGCQVLAPRRVTCATDAAQDLSVTLPLGFPAYMVSDRVRVTATAGAATASTGLQTFRPARMPVFDFSAPVLGDPVHTVGDGVDRFAVPTTAVLPPLVHGVVYRVSSPARFRDVAGPCTTSDDGTRFTCASAADGDTVELPLAVTGLDEPTHVDVTVSTVDDFDDPTPGDTTATLTLAPGADLALDLSVSSANPDRDALVALTGTLQGAPAGLSTVVYSLTGGATFPSAGNPGCTRTGDDLACAAPGDGQVALTVRASDRNQPTPLTVAVAPGAPYRAVGTGTHTATVTLPGRPVHDFSLTSLVATAHTVTADTDSYTLTAHLGDLPSDVSTVAFAASDGGTFAGLQSDDRCGLSATPGNGGLVVCTGLGSDQDVSLVVESTRHTVGDITVAVQPADPYDDLDPTDDAATVAGLHPGTHLTLSPHDLGTLHQNGFGNYPVSLQVGGVRAGVDTVALSLPAGLDVVRSGTDACLVTGGRLVCSGLVDGDAVAFTVSSATPARAGDLTVTARPGGDFVDLYDDNTAAAALGPAFDFTAPDLVVTAHTVSAGTDTYDLTGAVTALPGGLDALTFALTGGSVAADQGPGCARADATHVRCTGLGAGAHVTLRVETTSAAVHAVGVRVLVPDGYDDPDASDDAVSVTGLRPGTDLALAALDPDNDSPTNDDDQHLVDTRLTGVRSDLGSVVYTLTGAATFTHVDVAGCRVEDRTVTCTDPADGPVTFTVTAADVRVSTPVGITVEPGDPFVELDDSDNVRRATLAPRPTYDFSMGALDVSDHTLTGATDHYLVTSTVGPVPDGVDGVTFAVGGGTVADQQGPGCSRVDDGHLRCTDLAAARTVVLHVDSTSTAVHPVTVTLQLPRRYDDPTPSDNEGSVDVSPGVDLALGPLTPGDRVPTPKAYQVTTALTGVRTGPVTLVVSGGATVTASSCAVATPTSVLCADPQDGDAVSLTLRLSGPGTVGTVTVTAHAADPLVELDEHDNAVSLRLAPDVVLEWARVIGHRVPSGEALVRAQVSGVPAGTSTLRLRLSGAAVDSGDLHLTGRADGADGEGQVDCDVTDANGHIVDDGTYATCTRVTRAVGGHFHIDLRVAHPPLGSRVVTITALPVGVDEGGQTANNSLDLSIT